MCSRWQLDGDQAAYVAGGGVESHGSSTHVGLSCITVGVERGTALGTRGVQGDDRTGCLRVLLGSSHAAPLSSTASLADLAFRQAQLIDLIKKYQG